MVASFLTGSTLARGLIRQTYACHDQRQAEIFSGLRRSRSFDSFCLRGKALPFVRCRNPTAALRRIMTTRILGTKGGFTAAPKSPRPAPPPKRPSRWPLVLGLLVVLAGAYVVLQKTGTLERFF